MHRTGKDLAAPDRAVVAVAGAVEGEAERRLVPRAAFGKDARNVRAVMLDADAPARQRARELGAAVPGMQVVRDGQFAWRDLVHRAKVARRRGEGFG